MKIEISNRQTHLKINPTRLTRLSRWLMQQVQDTEPTCPWEELSVVIVDHPGMIALNQACFDVDDTTDVISYAYPPQPGEAGHSGEVIINAELAREEGLSRGGTRRAVADELAWYLAHGCDHLTGADDASDSERATMHERELAWLERARSEKVLDEQLVEGSFAS